MRVHAGCAMLVAMGFTTIATAAAVALPKVLESVSLREQSKQLSDAAQAQQQRANRQADSMVATAVSNQQRAARNAQARLDSAHAAAATAHLADDGTARMREVDLATRLQDEITHNANTSLQQAHAIREQGAYTAWNTRNSAARARTQARGVLLSGAGSLFGALSSSLSTTAYDTEA